MPAETLRPRRPRRDAVSSPEQETLSRVRRIETRVTQLLIAAGVGTQSQKPSFAILGLEGARLTLPSRHSSMKEILDNIPETWDGPVGVFVGTDRIATINR